MCSILPVRVERHVLKQRETNTSIYCVFYDIECCIYRSFYSEKAKPLNSQKNSTTSVLLYLHMKGSLFLKLKETGQGRHIM